MPLVIHGFGVGLAPSNLTVITTSVGVFDDQGFEIGLLQSINRDDSRPTIDVRHLNKADAGRIVEQQPGVETYALTVSGWMMYQKNDTSKQSLLNRLPSDVSGSGVFQVMNQQFIPFAIREDETHPATGATNVTNFLGCMLTSYSKPIPLTGTSVVETAHVKPSWVE
jgi:hypothetical protein